MTNYERHVYTLNQFYNDNFTFVIFVTGWRWVIASVRFI